MSYKSYIEQSQKIADLAHIGAVLAWDQETKLPPKGANTRARQKATLSGLIHQLSTNKEYGELLQDLIEDDQLDQYQKRNVSLSLKDYRLATKFTQEFVQKKSQKISECFQAWLEARKERDFKIFQKPLEGLIDMVREEAEILGYTDHPYDAMLDLYEPDLTVDQVDQVFDPLKKDLKELISKISRAQQVNDHFLSGQFSSDKQLLFGEYILKAIGYDMEAGRQDESAHPFSISFGPGDQRVTTRVDEKNFAYMLWSTIHEGGHALYEQGLPHDQYGLPLGQAISLSIHESQSRLWENNVGRSLPFWEAHYPELQGRFPAFQDCKLQDFYRGINKIEKNKIRTEADELHYHFHVIIRYEIEREIMKGGLDVSQLRDAWNDLYASYLNVTFGHDGEGILQDVHWAHGSIGYFPTYTLGSLYAAQFFAQANQDISGLQNDLAKGNCSTLLDWLRKKVHYHGKYYSADDLCKEITGSSLDASYFMDYATKKYTEIYQL